MKRIVPGIHSAQEVFNTRPKAIEEIWIREGDLHNELEKIFQMAKKITLNYAFRAFQY